MCFEKYLKNIKYAKKNDSWNIEGTLKNGHFKFDTRPLKNNVKIGYFNTKADKIVFDLKKEYVLIDVEELHQYLKEKAIKEINLETLISDLEWNILIKK